MKKIYALAITLISCSTIHAQGLEWAVKLGGSGSDEGNAIAVDASGNVYTTGNFNLNADFDPGAGVFELTTDMSPDVFISKLDASGNFVWAKHLLGLNQADYGRAIAVDVSGNVYVAGYFKDTVDFDPGAGVYELVSAGNDDAFILKLNSSGDFVWARHFGSTGVDNCMGIAVDGSGNVLATGQFRNTVDFDPGTGNADLVASGSNTYVLKLNSSGDFVWVKQFSGNQCQSAAIAIDGLGNVITTGLFGGTVDFDPDNGFSMTSNDADAFICKLNSSGDFIWAKQIGGIDWQEGKSVTVDATGGVIEVTGDFFGTSDLDPGTGVFELTSNGNRDIFIVRLNGDGDLVWAKQIGGPNYDWGMSVSMDGTGNTYVTGIFTDTVDFDPNNGVYELSTNVNNPDAYICKLDPQGNLEWAHQFGSAIYPEYGWAIATDNAGTIYSTGLFRQTVDFAPGPAVFDITSNGDYDSYVLKLNANGLGFDENSKLSQIAVYPNPASSSITIKLDQVRSIKVEDLSGKLLREAKGSSIYKLDISTYAPGVYFIRTAEGQTVKFIKE